MNKNAIYFPYINVPPTKFLVETLIYWDKLSSIVPYEFTVAPEKLSNKMRDLTSAGLVEQLVPSMYFDKLNNFEEEFLNIAIRWQEENKQLTSGYSRIHIEKLGSLNYKLIELNIAKNKIYPWVEMPTPLANIFMSILASELGTLSEINATAVTDLNRSSEQTISAIRKDILNHILPIPSGNVSIDSLLIFKNDFGHLAQKFRNKIEEECIDIISTNESLRSEKISLTKERLQNEIDEIEDSMRSFWKKISFGSLVPLIGTGLSIHTTNFTTQTIAATIGIGLSAIPNIYQGLLYAKEQGEIKQKPMAYATLTKRSLYDEFV